MKRVLLTISLFSLILFGTAQIQAQVPPGNSADNELVLYPNPTAGPLHIDFKSESRIKPLANILDITGKKVKQISDDLSYTSGRFSADISLADLKPGIYFVKFEQLGEVSLKKIVVR